MGVIATRWTQVEMATQRMLATLTLLDDSAGLAVTAHLGDRTAIDIILSMIKIYTNLGDLGKAVVNFTKLHDVCRENRNLFVHGNHAMSEAGIEPQISVIQRVTARGNIKIETMEVDVYIAMNLAREIAQTANYGKSIVDSLIGVREPGFRPTLTRPPSQPKRLLNTLRRVKIGEILLPRPNGERWTSIPNL